MTEKCHMAGPGCSPTSKISAKGGSAAAGVSAITAALTASPDHANNANP
jgi:hypothetical protein